MTTRQLIHSALRALGVLSEGKTPSASMLTDSIEFLNILLDSMAAEQLLPYDAEQHQEDLIVGKKAYVIGDGVVSDPDGLGSEAGGGQSEVTLDGDLCADSVGTFDIPRQVMFNCTGDESGNTFAIVGTNMRGDVITEAVTGANAAIAYGEKLFKTVTAITMTALADALVVGSASIIRTSRPNRISAGFIRNGSTDYPVGILTRDRYVEKPAKATAGRPRDLYYDKQYPSAIIWLFPVPDDADEDLFIECVQPFKHVSTTDYGETVNLPGEYLRALRWNLAFELAPEYGRDRTMNQWLPQFAMDTMNVVRESNGLPPKSFVGIPPQDIIKGQPVTPQV